MIQSIQRAVAILDCMKKPDIKYSIKEIAKMTSLSPSTVHRILSTLVECDFVKYEELSHRYELGHKLISLGLVATHNTDLRDLSKPLLKQLSTLTQEDSFLMIKSGDNGLIIQKETGPNNLKIVENFGYEIALHWGAIRKVLLAFQSEEYIQNYIKNNLKSTPTRLVLNPDNFIKDLNEIRKNKIAISIGDYIPNGVGIGAPVFDHTKKIIASIGIVGTNTRLNKNNIDKNASLVSDTAKKLSHMMGYDE